MARGSATETAVRSGMGRRFLSVAVCFVVVESLLVRLAEAGHLDVMRTGIAAAASEGLSVLGHQVALSGFAVATSAGQVTVARGCLPIVQLSLLLALFCFGVTIPLRRRLIWIAALTGIELMLEVARIMTVTALFEAGSANLEYIHLTVMPAVTLGVVVCCWLYECRASIRA